MSIGGWRAFAVGVGTNVGDRAGQVSLVARMLAADGGYRGLRTGRAIVTDPVVPDDRVDAHPPYLNTAIVGETTRAPAVVMARLLAIEAACGRRRRGAVDPRSLDLDLLVVETERIARPGLDLPHPRLAGRRFVLDPLLGLLATLDAEGGAPADLARRLREALVEAGIPISVES